MDDMNNSRSWIENNKFYEQLKAMDDMNDFKSWA